METPQATDALRVGSSALLACPFCGGAAKLSDTVYLERIAFYVTCTSCWARIDRCASATTAQVIWNKRHKPIAHDDDPVMGKLIREAYQDAEQDNVGGQRP